MNFPGLPITEPTSCGYLWSIDRLTPLYLLYLQELWQLAVRHVVSYSSCSQNTIPCLGYEYNLHHLNLRVCPGHILTSH